MENKIRNLSLIEDAIYFTKRNEIKKAVLIYENLLLNIPNDVSVLYFLGMLYQKENRYLEAISCFKKAIQYPEEQDTIYECRVELAFCYEILAEEKQSEYYRKAAKVYREDANLRLIEKLKKSNYFSQYLAEEESYLNTDSIVNTKEDFEANVVYAEMLVQSYSDAKAYEKAKL